MRCAAILVNYHGADLIAEAARSLSDDPFCDEIHVVDNSVCPAELEKLQACLPARAKLTVSPTNLGFAGACNLAFAQSSADFVLLLNPDARLLPGALEKLLNFLHHHPSAAAVGPRIFWDDEKKFLLPPSTYPARAAFFLDQLGKSFPALTIYRSQRYRKRALQEWRSTQPFRTPALSGGHVLLRTSALLSAGGLFDPRFFMYWEDSDLMRRLQDSGFELWLEPAAEAIHLYEHSPDKDKLINQGWPVFAEKYFANPAWRLVSKLGTCNRAAIDVDSFQPVTLEPACDALRFDVPTVLQNDWLLEFSPNPLMVPAMGCLGKGPIATLPITLKNRFRGLPCFIRLGSADPEKPAHESLSFILSA